jgi:hypothetical protein
MSWQLRPEIKSYLQLFLFNFNFWRVFAGCPPRRSTKLCCGGFCRGLCEPALPHFFFVAAIFFVRLFLMASRASLCQIARLVKPQPSLAPRG